MQDVISLSTGFVRKVEGVAINVVDSSLTMIMGALNADCYLHYDVFIHCPFHEIHLTPVSLFLRPLHLYGYYDGSPAGMWWS